MFKDFVDRVKKAFDNYRFKMLEYAEWEEEVAKYRSIEAIERKLEAYNKEEEAEHWRQYIVNYNRFADTLKRGTHHFPPTTM